MKKLLLITLLLCANFIFSQQSASIILNHDADNYGGFNMNNGVWVKSKQTETDLVGSNYLFKNWLNKAVVYDTEDKGYKLPNCNFNIQYNRFESNLSDASIDSVFSFDSRTINKFVIANKTFLKKKVDGKGSNYFMELIALGSEFTLYKAYSSKIVYAQVNPMTSQKLGNDMIKISEEYYTEKDGVLTPFKQKKSVILNLMASKKKQIKTFIKENKLSVSNEADLHKIFNYYHSL
ncbi:hypothetical protein KO494_07605 [Lacinutrix sp. C3R15]|uniref:hypothetical protein n=1 Tax=Flavobacteriaceae TaxID=49546 RepID=UPI001C09F792|nr:MULTISPECIES: hypothetical protein [Flavobacteriaceae]MBU2939403.1 hypothetical protein [Lacinutrix sp. C3R15]MDO6622718.1 hypothetical protein [Oceanihabitans sp. 1_MG-2023]